MSDRMMKDAYFQNMSDKNFERMLLDYSKLRNGEVADLTRAAAIRIGVLSAKVRQLEMDKGDDGK